jgi:hypothetical protein
LAFSGEAAGFLLITESDAPFLSPHPQLSVVPRPVSNKSPLWAFESAAESKRERRAKIINAEVEFQAAEKQVQAAAMISAQPIALQQRFLQTMKEISSGHNTTTILPVPINLFAPFTKRSQSRTPNES